MEKETNNITKAHYEDIFTVRTANEWLRAAKSEPVPKMLFGEFWLEGEMALLFGETGSGKSMLAVQIAESIARGRPIAPAALEATPQKVLYIDFELSGKQFEMRYTKDHEPGHGEFLKKHYRFSDKLHRVEIGTAFRLPDGFRSLEAYLLSAIKRLVNETGASVVVIDNITYLKRSYGVRECLEFMQGLNRMKKELGLSILVLARSERRDTARPVSFSDLYGAKILCNFADNVFAAGKSRIDRSLRYIKHIKPRSTEMIHDASHVPVFRIGKIGKNFLGFEHETFAPEADHLQKVHETRDWAVIDEIKRLSDLGMTIRAIAGQLNMPKSNVHRMLQMWKPPEAETHEEREEFDPKTHPSYFPGCEEYDDERDDPRFDDIYSREDEEAYLLRRESYLIEAARHRAQEEYERTGQCPPLHSDPEYAEFINGPPETPEIVEDCDGLSESLSDPENASLPIRLSPLSVRFDGYGREISVEKETPDGKPLIWYEYDSKGTKLRRERRGFAVISERIAG